MNIIALWHTFNLKRLSKKRIFDKHIWETENMHWKRKDRQELLLLKTIRVLGNLRAKNAIPHLTKSMKDFDATFMSSSISSAAAWALGEIGDPEAIEPLFSNTLEKLPSSPIALKTAIEALGKIGDNNVAAKLQQALMVDDEITNAMDKMFSTNFSESRRYAAMKALARMKGIAPGQYGGYEQIPIAQFLAGFPLPLDKRREQRHLFVEDASKSKEILLDFGREAEKEYESSMRLKSGIFEPNKAAIARDAIERAKRIIMGAYGLTLQEAEKVSERFISQSK